MTQHLSYNPHVTFNALWELLEMFYGEGLWSRDWEDEKKTGKPRMEMGYMNYLDSGAFATTGGLSIYMGTIRFPRCIETPWGEWTFRHSWAYGELDRILAKEGNKKLAILLRKLDIDIARSTFFSRGHPVIALASVTNLHTPPQSRKRIPLPAYAHIPVVKNGVYWSSAQWTELCDLYGRPTRAIRYGPETAKAFREQFAKEAKEKSWVEMV